jgi:uncharacterized protein YkwD
MVSVVSLFRTLFKITFAIAMITGVLGVGAVVGLCGAGDAGFCGSDGGSSTSTPTANTSSVVDDVEDANQDFGSTVNRETQSEPQTDTRENDATDDDAPVDRDPIDGPDPPPYPDRTDKEWDKTLSFAGDPGETVINESFWNVSSEAVERFVARLVNDYRVDNGRERMKYSHALASVSRAHSADMSDRQYFAHENPDGERSWDRWGSGHCRTWYGENLFASWAGTNVEGEPEPMRTASALAEKTLEGWQNSPPHDEAMRAPGWDVAGYGVYFSEARDGDGYKMLVTMNMCIYNEHSRP